MVTKEVTNEREQTMGNGTGFYTEEEMKTELKWTKTRDRNYDVSVHACISSNIHSDVPSWFCYAGTTSRRSLCTARSTSSTSPGPMGPS